MSAARAHRRATILLYAAIQFVALTAIAMAVYAGGTTANPWSPGYDFTGNFLSDLGALCGPIARRRWEKTNSAPRSEGIGTGNWPPATGN